jgi:hypothetical protein
VNHPNSVSVFSTEEIASAPIIAMELVPGGTLEERVRRDAPLPVGEAVDAILQVIDGREAGRVLPGGGEPPEEAEATPTVGPSHVLSGLYETGAFELLLATTPGC